MTSLVRGCGVVLVIGAILLVLTNAILTPLMPIDSSEEALRTSNIYFARMICALITPFCFVFGTIGLHLALLPKQGKFGSLAFVVLLVGNILLVGLEWANLFVFRAVAQTAPETLALLDESKLVTIGFAVTLGAFTLGWILMSINVWLTAILPRYAALLTLAGLVSLPLLAVSPLGPLVGQIVGNAILGTGLASLGLALTRIESPDALEKKKVGYDALKTDSKDK